MGESVSALVDGHHLHVETCADARLAMIIDTIDAAQATLQLMFYIFAGDAVGQSVIAALIRACGRGVDVCLIVDGFGSQDQPDSVFASLVAAGGRFARFNPKYGRRYLLRNHQKMLIADNQTALIGGNNISDDYHQPESDPNGWHDLMLRIDGPAVARLEGYYRALTEWVEMPALRVHQLRTILTDYSEAVGALRWLHGGFFSRLSPLTRAIRNDIDRSRTLVMVEAFFAPNWAMLRKLGQVVQRGGTCNIITAGHSATTTTVAASRHCYHRLLSSGVELYEYGPKKLHMKLIIADDAVYIGSANFDARSLYINVELMLRIEDSGFAAQMRQFAQLQQEKCVLITATKYAARATWLNRLRWFVAYFIVSTLDYSVSRRLNIIGEDQ